MFTIWVCPIFDDNIIVQLPTLIGSTLAIEKP